MKVIRIIEYEGTAEDVRRAIRQSKQLGTHEFDGYTLTIVEYLNELPPLVEIPKENIESLLKTAKLLNLLDR